MAARKATKKVAAGADTNSGRSRVTGFILTVRTNDENEIEEDGRTIRETNIQTWRLGAQDDALTPELIQEAMDALNGFRPPSLPATGV